MKPLGHLTVGVIGALLVAAVIEGALWLSHNPTARTLVVGTIAAAACAVMIFRVGRSDA